VGDWTTGCPELWLTSIVEHLRLSDRRLGSFDGENHRHVVREFQTADREHIETTPERVRRLCAEHAVAAKPICSMASTTRPIWASACSRNPVKTSCMRAKSRFSSGEQESHAGIESGRGVSLVSLP
jgi:hypothetical protein